MAHDGRWRRESGPDSSTVGAGSFLELEMAPLVLLTFLGGTNLLYWIALVIVTRPWIEYDLAMHCNSGYSAGIKEDWRLVAKLVFRICLHETADCECDE